MEIKKIILIIILAYILFPGCEKQNSGVEIVPNLEAEYLSLNDVDILPNFGKSFNEKMENDFKDAVKNLHVNNSEAWFLFNIDIRIYINENGSVDKFKNLISSENNFKLPDSVQEYKDREKLDRELALKLASWKFEPAIKNGNKVKIWTDMRSVITLSPEGVYNVGTPSFLFLPSPDEFVFADKMPSIIENSIPHYPALAKMKGKEGNVYVKVFVDSDGKPVNAIILKSDDEVFNQPSLDAALKFKFSPAINDNKHIGVWVVIPFKYKLKKADVMQYQDLEK